jgi:uroporphyrinogen-III synthase
MFELLDKEKVKYTKAIIYKTVASNLSNLDINKYDLMIFFSPAGIKSLQNNFPDYIQGEKIIAAFGNTTATAVAEAGLKLNIPAPTQSAPSMSMAIEQFLINMAKENRKNGRNS